MLVEADALREKECGDAPRFVREAFLFWDDRDEQISIGNTTGYGSGRTDELRDASLRADGRYFECASIAGAAARFEESDQSSGYKNYHGWNRTKRGGAAAGSTCCVFGA